MTKDVERNILRKKKRKCELCQYQYLTKLELLYVNVKDYLHNMKHNYICK